MTRKKYKPTTPGIRHQVRLVWDKDAGDQSVPKGLRVGKIQTGGRNNRGRITNFHQGGGNKRLLREIKTPTLQVMDDALTKTTWKGESVGVVKGIQYDPNRTARLALIQPEYPTVIEQGQGPEDTDRVKRMELSPESTRPYYMIATKGMSVGDRVAWYSSYEGAETTASTGRGGSRVEANRTPGSTVFLRDVSVGMSVYNIETNPMGGGKRVRAAGTHATIQRKNDEEAWIVLPSGKVRRFSLRCRVTMGTVGGEEHRLEVTGKAGKNRHRSIRPTVRGCAMNPIDHPHGGRTRGGRPTMTPWSRVAKGKPTRKKHSPFVVM